MNISVETIPVGVDFQTNCYLAVNADTNELVVVDPGAEAGKIIGAIGGRTPVAILITHGHFDHIAAADALCERYRIPLYIHALDAPKLADGKMNESVTFSTCMTIHTKPQTVVDNQTLSLAGMEFTVLHTPGHSKGGVCYLLPGGKGVFCGDTLFSGGYGRYDIGDGSFSELKQSLRRLVNLQPKMIAYPGHGPTTFAGK